MKKFIATGVLAVALTTTLTACSPMDTWPLSLFQTEEQKLDSLMTRAFDAMGQSAYYGELTEAEVAATKDEFLALLTSTCFMGEGMLTQALMGIAQDEGVSLGDATTARDALLEARTIVCGEGDA